MVQKCFHIFTAVFPSVSAFIIAHTTHNCKKNGADICLRRQLYRKGCFAAFPEPGDAHGCQQNDVGGCGKGGHIDRQTDREGDQRLNQTEYRQGRLTMGADEEHVKGIRFQKPCKVGHFIHHHGNENSAQEYRQCFQKGLVLQLHIAGIQKINTHCDHGAVTEHGLEINTHRVGKHIAGVEHDAGTGEDREGSQIRAYRIMQLALAGKAGDQPGIQRRGAELPGEGIPFIVKGDRAVTIFKTVVDLLIGFQDQGDDGDDPHSPADTAVVTLFMGRAQDHCQEYVKREGNQMEYAVRLGTFHLTVQKLQNTDPKVQGSSLPPVGFALLYDNLVTFATAFVTFCAYLSKHLGQ